MVREQLSAQMTSLKTNLSDMELKLNRQEAKFSSRLNDVQATASNEKLAKEKLESLVWFLLDCFFCCPLFYGSWYLQIQKLKDDIRELQGKAKDNVDQDTVDQLFRSNVKKGFQIQEIEDRKGSDSGTREQWDSEPH